MKLREIIIIAKISLVVSYPLHAQDFIQLDENSLSRLGIVSSPVMAVDNSIGASFPATIINSPLTTSTVAIPYDGILQSWQIEPGAQVSSGDILVEIRSQELLDLQNDWNNARVDLEQQRFELEKDSILLEEGIISRQRLSQTQRNYQQAESLLQSLTAKLNLAGFNENQMNNFDALSSERGVYSVRSPVSGTMDHLMINAGTYVEANSPIASIGSNERWLSAQLPARIASPLEIGQRLRVAGSNVPLTLRQKDYAIDPQTQTIEIFAVFDALPQLMAGQVVTLILPPAKAGILIPGDSVVHRGDETTVYIQSDGGFEARSLNLSPAGADYLAMDGISPGEQIVIRGAAILKGMQLGLGGE